VSGGTFATCVATCRLGSTKWASDMPRPRTPLGAHGSISTKELEPGRWQAQTRFRDSDGVSRVVRARAKTRAGAVTELRRRLTTRSTPVGGRQLTRTSRVSVAARIWLAVKQQSNVAPSTLERYEGALRKYILPPLGSLALGELTPGRVTQFLQSLPGNHKLVRTVLSQVLEWAVNEDAIPINPVKQALPTSRITSAAARPAPRALQTSDLAAFERSLKRWRQLSGSSARSIPLWDLALLMLATGMRIAEALALKWENIDFESRTVSVEYTLSAVKGGLIRKSPKTPASRRQLLIPAVALAMLARRQEESGGKAGDPVFPSAAGNWLWPHNVRRALKGALSEDIDGQHIDWIRPHTLRKTAGTLVVVNHGLLAGSDFLGHGDPAETSRSYFDPSTQRLDVTGAFDVALSGWN
jgi:integrase